MSRKLRWIVLLTLSPVIFIGRPARGARPPRLTPAEAELFARRPDHPLFGELAFVPLMGRASNLRIAHAFHFVSDAVHALIDPTYDWAGAKPLAIKQLRQDIEAVLGASLTEFDPAREARPPGRCTPMFTDD